MDKQGIPGKGTIDIDRAVLPSAPSGTVAMKKCHRCGDAYPAKPRPRDEGWRATCDRCRAHRMKASDRVTDANAELMHLMELELPPGQQMPTEIVLSATQRVFAKMFQHVLDRLAALERGAGR